jgi:hypothetical protein
MDYKYIEQLLEKYWNCETSVEEEQILRSFFRQKELPEHLLRYKSLFAYQEAEKDIKLGDDFDSRILAEIERPVVKARRLTLHTRFMPLFKAAAVMVVLFPPEYVNQSHRPTLYLSQPPDRQTKIYSGVNVPEALSGEKKNAISVLPPPKFRNSSISLKVVQCTYSP